MGSSLRLDPPSDMVFGQVVVALLALAQGVPIPSISMLRAGPARGRLQGKRPRVPTVGRRNLRDHATAFPLSGSTLTSARSLSR